MKRIANFCPSCGHAIAFRNRHGQLRPVCPNCGFVVYHDPKVAVIAFLEQNEQVLLVKRANDPGRGLWACPAGFVEHNEDPEHAVIREMREETGLIVRVEHVMRVFGRKDGGLADIVIAYRVRQVGGTLVAADDAEEAAWFRRDNLPAIVFYPSVQLVGIEWRNGRI